MEKLRFKTIEFIINQIKEQRDQILKTTILAWSLLTAKLKDIAEQRDIKEEEKQSQAWKQLYARNLKTK